MSWNSTRALAAVVSLLVMAVFSLPPLRSVLGIGLHRRSATSLYARDDAWARYLAPESVCPGGKDLSAPVAAQRATMFCLLDWARQQRGLGRLEHERALDESSWLKAALIRQCDEFSHTPCGHDFAETFRRAGYVTDGVPSMTGENIAWGESRAAAPRVIVDRWLNSDGHRENLFRGEWRDEGLALLEVPSFRGSRPGGIWVHEFGRHATP